MVTTADAVEAPAGGAGAREEEAATGWQEEVSMV
jgi:hypothetical protein